MNVRIGPICPSCGMQGIIFGGGDVQTGQENPIANYGNIQQRRVDDNPQREEQPQSPVSPRTPFQDRVNERAAAHIGYHRNDLRIEQLQAKATLTPGERIELELLLGRKWK